MIIPKSDVNYLGSLFFQIYFFIYFEILNSVNNIIY
jgi:hypothetical protein